MSNSEHELESYAQGSISTKNEKIPRWLLWVYILAPIWGVVWLVLFWNGSSGWIDRGAWHSLQKAANTVYSTGNSTSLKGE